MAQGAHILVAEDEVLVARALAEILQSEGFRVTVTHNGLEAIEADAVDPADLLITDMRMPIINGAALIATLRTNRPSLPVIITTGYSDTLPEEEDGRLVILHKPFSLSGLMRHVEIFLSNQQS